MLIFQLRSSHLLYTCWLYFWLSSPQVTENIYWTLPQWNTFNKRTTSCLLREIKDVLHKQDIPCSRTGKLTIVKVIFPQMICKLNPIALKISHGFLPTKLNKHPEIHQQMQKPQLVRKKQELKDWHWFSDLLHSHGSRVVWKEDRPVTQRNRTESPEINPDVHGPCIFNNRMSTTRRGKICKMQHF